MPGRPTVAPSWARVVLVLRSMDEPFLFGICLSVSSPSRFAAECATGPMGPRPVAPTPVLSAQGRENCCAVSTTTGACPCLCPRRSRRHSPRWPSGFPIGDAGVPRPDRDTQPDRRGGPPARVASVVDGAAFPLGIPMSEAEGIQMGSSRVGSTRPTPWSPSTPPRAGTRGGCPSVRTSSPSCCSARPTGTAWPTPPTGRAPMAGGSTTATRPRPSPRTGPRSSGSNRSGRWCHGASSRRGPGQGPPAAGARLCHHPGPPRRGLALGNFVVEPGDVLLVRTGQAAHLALPGRPGIGDAPPARPHRLYLAHPRPDGVHRRVVPRPRRGRMAIDTMVLEVYPCESDDLFLPVHLLHLVEMGDDPGAELVPRRPGPRLRGGRSVRLPAGCHPPAVHRRAGSPVNPIALR